MLAAMLAGGLALGGCTLPGGAGGGDDGDDGAAAAGSSAVDDGRPNPTPPNDEGGADEGGNVPDGATGDLAAEIDAIIAARGGQAGAAVARPGSAGDGGAGAPQVAGDLVADVAWSTSKVPIAIASVRATGAADANVNAAITVSDNAAAEAMWASLGDPVARMLRRPPPTRCCATVATR